MFQTVLEEFAKIRQNQLFRRKLGLNCSKYSMTEEVANKPDYSQIKKKNKIFLPFVLPCDKLRLIREIQC